MTSLQKFNSAFCILNIVICLLLLLDDYVAGTFTVTETCKEKTIAYSRSRSGREWKSFLVRTVSQKEYNLPEYAWHDIAENDSFIIHRTNIFKKAIGVSYAANDRFYYQGIGVINGSGFGLFVIVLCISGSSLLLIFTLAFKRKIEARHILIFSFICLVIIYFYFWNQS